MERSTIGAFLRRTNGLMTRNDDGIVEVVGVSRLRRKGGVSGYEQPPVTACRWHGFRDLHPQDERSARLITEFQRSTEQRFHHLHSHMDLAQEELARSSNWP